MRARRVALLLPGLLLALVTSACGDQTDEVAASGSPTASAGSATPSPTDDGEKDGRRDGGKKGGKDEPSATPSAAVSVSDLPACASVWVAEQVLPKQYAGCRSEGRALAAHGDTCSFGRVLFTYDRHFYAVPGFKVNYYPDGLASSRDYRQARAACGG